MNVRELELKVVEYIKNGCNWNEFICSLDKRDLKEFLDSEDWYMGSAKSRIGADNLYDFLKSECSDNLVHCFIGKEFRGITEQFKDMLIYKNGAIYHTYQCEYDSKYDWCSFATDHYGLKVHCKASEFKDKVTNYVLEHPQRFTTDKEEIYMILRHHYEGLEKVF